MINDITDITSFKWATVTAVNPLGIKLDGDTASLALIPDSLIDPRSLSIGSRVRVELSLRKVVIHGANAGSDNAMSPIATVTAAAAFLSGVRTQKQGQLVVATGSFTPLASGGSWTSAFQTLGNIIAEHRPARDLLVAPATSMGQVFQILISSATGDVTIRTLAGTLAQTTNNNVSLSGLSWPTTL